MTTLAAINKKIDQLKKQADAIVQAGRREAVAKARDLIEKFALTADDLGLGKAAKRGRISVAKKASSTAAGTPKYKDPTTGKTWTGVGRAPAWIAAAKDRSKFLMDAGAGAGSEADAASPKVRDKKKAGAAGTAKASKASAPVKAAKKAAGKTARRAAGKKAGGSAEPLPTAAEQAGTAQG